MERGKQGLMAGVSRSLRGRPQARGHGVATTWRYGRRREQQPGPHWHRSAAPVESESLPVVLSIDAVEHQRSAGVYSITQTTASLAILEEKMRHAASTGANAVITANPGCILQLRAGLAH